MDGRLQTTVNTAGAATNRVVIYQEAFGGRDAHNQGRYGVLYCTS